MRHRNPCIQWEICVPCSTHKSIHITIEFVIHICIVSIEDSFSLSTVISCLLLYFICFQKKKYEKSHFLRGGRERVGGEYNHSWTIFWKDELNSWCFKKDLIARLGRQIIIILIFNLGLLLMLGTWVLSYCILYLEINFETILISFLLKISNYLTTFEW